MMQRCSLVWTAAFALTVLCTSIEARGDVDAVLLNQFQNEHPRARIYNGAETMDAIYGTVFSNGATPLESAWNHVNRWQAMFGNDIGQFVPQVNASGDVLQGVMFNHATQTHKFYTFRFNQFYNGVPVFRKGVGFLVRNEQGNPLVLSGFDVKDMQGFNVAAPAGDPQVTAVMMRNVRGLMMNGQPVLRSVMKPAPAAPELATEISGERHVIWAGVDTQPADPELAVEFVATRGSVTTYPDYQKYLVIASVATGEILHSETQIHNLTDINGNVSGVATNGIRSAECDPEATFGLPYAEVNVVGGNTAFADVNGNFTIPHGGNSQVNVRSRLRGRWFEVFDQTAGGAIPEIITPVTPPGPANFLHNPTNTEFPRANVNAYLESNVVRDYVLSFEPTFPVIANQQFFNCNTNLNQTCNAFYDGNSINFYRAGGGCPNTSFSDVVYHEYGHHLVAVTGNGQNAFGEGSGDCMAVLIQDDPILAPGWNVNNCNGGLRTAVNNLQYPCSTPIHTCGGVLSGCVWDTRNALVITEPANYRDIGGALFLGMMVTRGMQGGSGTITPFITILYLELDDNDGDIGNGTPHYNEIAAGFGAHNMDAPPLDLLDFNYPSGRPTQISPSGGIEFVVEVTGQAGSPEPGTGVLHVDRGNGFESFPMNEISSNVYEANFPPTECGTEVAYYISVETTSGGIDFDPSNAPISFYTATSAVSIEVAFEDNFQTNMGWSVSGNATTGHWQRAVPNGGGQRGDPPTDADGSGQCYVTQNGAGDTDIDGGSTILTSPVMDASGMNDAEVSYSRWYSNDFGADPMADIFVVEISNNGGTTWTNLETVGPGGPEVSGGWIKKSFRIADYVTPTNQIRLRFNASDLSSPSVVEAGVDAVKIQEINCDGGPVCADGGIVIEGANVLNDFNAACGSDDSRWGAHGEVFAFQFTDPVVQFQMSATSSTNAPGSISIDVEASKDNNNAVLNLRALLWNFNAGSYVALPGSMVLTTSDAVQTFNLPNGATPADFVDPGTGEVRLLLQTIQTSGVPNVRTLLDDVLFNMN